jgi:hypothetical protein
MAVTLALLARCIPPPNSHCPPPGPKNMLALSKGKTTLPSDSVIVRREVGSWRIMTCLVGVLQGTLAAIVPVRPRRLMVPPVDGSWVQAERIHASAVVPEHQKGGDDSPHWAGYTTAPPSDPDGVEHSGENVASRPLAYWPVGHGAVGLDSCKFPGVYTFSPFHTLLPSTVGIRPLGACPWANAAPKNKAINTTSSSKYFNLCNLR